VINWKKIKADYKKGMSIKELSQIYGVKVNTIKSRKKREKWEKGDSIEVQDKKETIKTNTSVFSKGYSPEELLARENEEGFMEEILKKAYYATISQAIYGSTTIEEVYNASGELVRKKITRKPPTPLSVNNLLLLGEQISLSTINIDELETEEEREARYLDYRRDIEEQRKLYENRNIEKELEELNKEL